jgi:DNA invertase Pin-like site-specific DNA recombinase
VFLKRSDWRWEGCPPSSRRPQEEPWQKALPGKGRCARAKNYSFRPGKIATQKAEEKRGVMTGEFGGVFGQGVKVRVGIYARVSTRDQQTLPLQLAAMTDYVRRRGWLIAVQIEDVGSGAAVRPRREELLQSARRRETDLILVWRLDRWGRSLLHLIGSLQELTALGVGFASITEALDLTTPAGRAMAGMLAVFAEFEREILRDRVRSGIAQARRNGKPHGRPPTARQHAAEARSLLDHGVSKRAIAKKLGISRSSVRRVAG